MENSFVKILYSSINFIEHSLKWDKYMVQLSAGQQEEVKRFVKWEDRCRALFGKILTKELLEHFGFRGDLIEKVKRTEFGRPYLQVNLDFNISHSGDYVIGVASENCRVGIDIEKWTTIDFKEFQRIMTKQEWRRMNESQNIIPEFFHLWTQKECVIKADGRGLSRPLNEIESNQPVINDQGKTWYVSILDFQKGYSASLATSKPNPHIEMAEKAL